MNRKFALIAALPFVLLAACTRIIERPAPSPSVVTTPAISERTVERSAPAAAGASAPACTWASQSYSSGAISCQEGAQYRCNNGSWERTETRC
jgi:hypothetical protein